jgi:hypothetical protein
MQARAKTYAVAERDDRGGRGNNLACSDRNDHSNNDRTGGRSKTDDWRSFEGDEEHFVTFSTMEMVTVAIDGGLLEEANHLKGRCRSRREVVVD